MQAQGEAVLHAGHQMLLQRPWGRPRGALHPGQRKRPTKPRARK